MQQRSGTDSAYPDGEQWLRDLAHRIATARTRMRVTVTAAAQSAGVARRTWQRIEAADPGVAAGTYAKALAVLGLVSAVTAGVDPTLPAAVIPIRIRVGDYPELSALAWSLQPDTQVTPRQALDLYERNGRYLRTEDLTDVERTLIENLREGLADDVRP